MTKSGQALRERMEKEGDFHDWIDSETGYECAIRRIGKLGHLCGYVRVPETHPYFEKPIMQTELDVFKVHWGLTYDGKMDFVMDDLKTPDPHNKEGYWIGFDYAHAGDIVPSIYFKHGLMFGYETYKDMEFVKKECKKLARQLKKLDNGYY